MELLLAFLYEPIKDPQNAIQHYIRCQTYESRNAERYAQEIIWIANKHAMDPILIAAIVDVESKFRARAISSTKDYGAMQVNERTAKSLDKDPEELLTFYSGVDAGTSVLKNIKRKYALRDINWICRYNVGNQRGEKISRICDRYLRKVMLSYNSIRSFYNFYPHSICSEIK